MKQLRGCFILMSYEKHLWIPALLGSPCSICRAPIHHIIPFLLLLQPCLCTHVTLRAVLCTGVSVIRQAMNPECVPQATQAMGYLDPG